VSRPVLADLDPVATEFASTVAGLLADRVDHAFLTSLDDSPGTFPEALWKDLTALGCTEVVTEPQGVSLAAAILAEFGYAGLPSPLTGSLLAALGARIAGADDAVPKAMVARGEPIAALLPTRLEACPVTLHGPPDRTTVTGGPCLGEWIADGARLIVVCRDGGGRPALVMVDPARGGTTVEPVRSIDHSASHRVSFADAPVTEVLAERLSADEWHALSALSGLLRAATLAGLCARACDLTVRHVRDRVQFGKSLSQLQAVRLTVADMLTDLTCVVDLVTQAATHSDARTPRSEHHNRIATIFATQAAERILGSASQLHGGTGFIVEHSLHFFYRHAKGLQLRLGGTEQLLEIASTRLLPAMASGPWDWLDFE
jgi:alkylation response protein AidB-like acyl-CoA dehydrogenase